MIDISTTSKSRTRDVLISLDDPHAIANLAGNWIEPGEDLQALVLIAELESDKGLYRLVINTGDERTERPVFGIIAATPNVAEQTLIAWGRTRTLVHFPLPIIGGSSNNEFLLSSRVESVQGLSVRHLEYKTFNLPVFGFDWKFAQKAVTALLQELGNDGWQLRYGSYFSSAQKHLTPLVKKLQMERWVQEYAEKNRLGTSVLLEGKGLNAVLRIVCVRPIFDDDEHNIYFSYAAEVGTRPPKLTDLETYETRWLGLSTVIPFKIRDVDKYLHVYYTPL